MRQFEIVIFTYGTLKAVLRYVIEARDVDSARNIGMERNLSSNPNSKYPSNLYFVGAQNV